LLIVPRTQTVHNVIGHYQTYLPGILLTSTLLKSQQRFE